MTPRSEQPGSQPIDIPDERRNPATDPARRRERESPSKPKPAKVPVKTIFLPPGSPPGGFFHARIAP
jgi:hypothetical protein